MQTYMLDSLIDENIEVLYTVEGREEYCTGTLIGHDFDVIGIDKNSDGRRVMIFKSNIVEIMKTKLSNKAESNSKYVEWTLR